ncbi:hypothetical protein JCM1840_006828 [Sporobolomyces johnsonii]
MSSVASEALAVPSIVHRVFCYLAEDAVTSTDPKEHEAPGYADLCQASLVCRAWVQPAQHRLFAALYFPGGTKQLQRWLDTVGERPVPYSTETVMFEDARVILEDVRDDKWDFEVVGRVLQKLKGVTEMSLCFRERKEIPVEILLDDGLKGLKILLIDSPLSTPPPMAIPPFQHLETLLPINIYPGVVRDWSSTFDFLARRTNASLPPTLRSLSLSCFMGFETYLFPALTPFAHSIHFLGLPVLILDWRHITFAQNCHHLQDLHVRGLTPGWTDSLKLLLAFPHGLSHLYFDRVQGIIGGHRNLPPGATNFDPWRALLKIIYKMPSLKVLDIGLARFLYPSQHAQLNELGRLKGFEVNIETIDNSYSAAELAEFLVFITNQSLSQHGGAP